MQFLRKLFSSRPSDQHVLRIHVRCARCGERISARVDLRYDLSLHYEGDKTGYVCRKTLVGSQRCFQRVEVELIFDESQNLVDKSIQGGSFVNQPPE